MNEYIINVTDEIAISKDSAYPNNVAPLQEQPLLKLPIGSIKPDAWLKKQLSLMLDGVTGRLYEFGDFFSEEKNGWFYNVDKGWEEVPYWLRGFYPLAVLTNDKRCLDVAQKYIDIAINSQDEQGYFGPKNLKNIQGDDGRITTDLWPHMLLLHPIISYYEYTNDQRVIPFITKFFMFCKNLPDDQFIIKDGEGNGGWGGSSFGAFAPFLQYTRAGDMYIHLIWLYNQTKKQWILELMTRFHDHTRPPWDEWLDHHAVNFAQRFAYDGIYSLLSKDPADMDKTDNYYQEHMKTWGQMPRGMFAADERIRPGCTDPRQAFETCGMVEFAKNFYDLGRITGNPLYGDKIEDILLNHFTVTYTSDQKAVHYVTGANMPKISEYKHHPFRNGKESSDRSYVAYTPFNRCCGHNAGIGWPQYANNLLQATSDNGIACLLYGAFEANVMVGEKKEAITIYSKSNYPFKGDVSLSIKGKAPVFFPLYLRIPTWSKQFSVLLNGKKILTTYKNQKWVKLYNHWNDNDVIKISMAMEVSLTTWPTNGSVTVNRGPLSYSVKIKEGKKPIKDLGPTIYMGNDKWQNYIISPLSPWNYGLVIDEKTMSIDNTVTIKDCSIDMPFDSENAPIEITVKGKKIVDWTLQDDTASELQNSPIKSDEAIEEITLIPLGCARLRMSCLPTISDCDKAKKWVKTPSHIPFDKRAKNKFDELFPMKRVTDNDDL